MLISQALAHAKAITGSAFSDAEALRWLGELDGKLALDFYGADAFSGYTEEDAVSALLVPWPWDGLYVHFLESMIYYSNGEYDRSRNARAMYEKVLDDFRKALRRKCCPVTPDQMSTRGGSAVTVVTASDESPWFYLSAYALAVKHGFQGTEQEWLESIGHTVPMDDTPTPGSEKAVKSGGLYTALAGKQDTLTFDANPTPQSYNPVYSGGVYAGFATISQNFSAAMQQMDARKQNALTFDTAPAAGSTNPVTSGGVYSHYVGAGRRANTTAGSYSTAEGHDTTASGDCSHAEGYNTTASGGSSHAEGGGAAARGIDSHAEGCESTASGNYSHAEGMNTTASGNCSHAEDYQTTASGACSHAEGMHTTASGERSHAEGYYTTAAKQSQHVFGEYNIADAASTDKGEFVEIVGNGTSGTARSNARTLDWSGNETLSGKLTMNAPGTGTNDAVTHGQMDTALSGKQDALTFDPAPAAGSTNPVTSGGVYSALAETAEELAEDLADLNPPQTASGSVVTFTSAAAGNPVNPLIVNIEPVQSGSGDPSPENIRPITGWTGATVTLSPTQDAADGTVYTISFGSAGTVYGGTLDVARGLLKVDRAAIDLGTLTYGYDSSNKDFYVQNLPNVARNANNETARILSDRFTPVSRDYFVANKTVDGLIAINSSKSLIIRMLEYTIPANFKAAVSGSLLVYTLATPEVFRLTPQEIRTLLGVNNLWADCGDISATYRTGTAAPVLTTADVGVAGGAAAYNDVMARLAALEAAVVALGGNI